MSKRNTKAAKYRRLLDRVFRQMDEYSNMANARMNNHLHVVFYQPMELLNIKERFEQIKKEK